MEATRSPLFPRALAILTVAGGVALLVAAHVAWSLATPAPGERRFTPARVGAAQAAAVTCAVLAHASMLGVAMPLIYRPRPAYLALAIAGGVLATIAGVTAAALYASAG